MSLFTTRGLWKGLAARLLAPCLALSLLIPALPLAAQASGVAAVDQNNGYSSTVLDKVLAVWTPPAIKGNQLLRLRVSIDGQGQVAGCTPTRSSGYPALDVSACNAVKAAAPFGNPPYGLPLDVHMAFWTGNITGLAKTTPAQTAPASNQAANLAATPAATPAPVVAVPQPAAVTAPPVAAATAPAQEPPATGLTPQEQQMQIPGQTVASNTPSTAENDPQYKKYFSNVRWKLRNTIYIPVETKPGDYTVTVRLHLAKGGHITSYDILKSSGDERLDKYVRQGIRRAGSVATPPAELGDTLDITLKLTRY